MSFSLSSLSLSSFVPLDYMIQVLSGTVVNKVIAALESCEFQCLIAGIGGNGVEICFGSCSS